MKVDVKEIKACCGRTQTVLVLGKPLEIEYLQLFITNGFTSIASYGKQGIFYIENRDIIATGSIGSNRLEFKRKTDKSNEAAAIITHILETI